MKRSNLSLLICSLFAAGSLNAATIYQGEDGDSIDLIGSFEVGGYLGKDYNDNGEKWDYDSFYSDDTFMSFGFVVKTGQIFAHIDFDYERTPWTTKNEFQQVLDKAYVGWEFENGDKIEFGRTDTAYDHYDQMGDFSVDGAAEVREAGDQDSTAKYRGSINNFKYGISYSTQGWDNYKTDSREGEVINGYLGYFNDSVDVLLGAETVDQRGEIYSVHARGWVGPVRLGGLVSLSDREEEQGYDSKDALTYVASIGYDITDKIETNLVYSIVDVDTENRDMGDDGFRTWVDDSWVAISLNYKYRRNIVLKTEFVTGGEQGSYGYGKVYYWF
ncbi:hypothetical protein [Agarivorans sp. Z349TD_8]|uniref:hypothetical protein n=1 Tax=Agarivorans sp. Z349TD_8 TaxID=3421434 RepID=UPI003D7ED026